MSVGWKCADFEEFETRVWRAAEAHKLPQNEGLPDRVLTIGLPEKDRRALKQILRDAPVRIHSASSLAEAEEVLRQARVPVILADAGVGRHNRAKILDLVQSWPRPQLVVATATIDDDLCSEVLAIGGFDVVGKPFSADEVRWILEDAWHEWKHQLHLLKTPDGAQRAAESAG